MTKRSSMGRSFGVLRQASADMLPFAPDGRRVPLLGVGSARARSERSLRVCGLGPSRWLTRAGAQRPVDLATRAHDQWSSGARRQGARALRAVSRARFERRRKSLPHAVRRVPRAREPHQPRSFPGRATPGRRRDGRLHQLPRLHAAPQRRGATDASGVVSGGLCALPRGAARQYAGRGGARLEPLRELPPAPPGCETRARPLRQLSPRYFDPTRGNQRVTRARVHDLPPAPAPARASGRGVRDLPALPRLPAPARARERAVRRGTRGMRRLSSAARVREEGRSGLSFVPRGCSRAGGASCRGARAVHELPCSA